MSQARSDDVRKFVGDLLAMSSVGKRLCTFLHERSGIIIFVCIIFHIVDIQGQVFSFVVYLSVGYVAVA